MKTNMWFFWSGRILCTSYHCIASVVTGESGNPAVMIEAGLLSGYGSYMFFRTGARHLEALRPSKGSYIMRIPYASKVKAEEAKAVFMAMTNEE